LSKQSKKNRRAGTLVTRRVTVNKQVIWKVFTEHLLPAIKSLDTFKGKLVMVQQDNARPHLSPADLEFVKALAEGGWDIKLGCQTANSPNLNITGLGFFRAIQAIQQQITCTSVDDLISAVQRSFLEYTSE
jgi:hypothetical protein